MLGANSLSISDIRSGNACVLALSGRIDSTNAHELGARLTQLLAAGEKALLVDFGDVRYLTSAAFRVLLVANGEARSNAARLVLCRVQGHVRELFEIGGLLDAFAIHGTREEALATVG